MDVNVNVTNLVDPYLICVYETKDYNARKNELALKLEKYHESMIKPEKKEDTPLGSMVLTGRLLCDIYANEIPSYICRGLLTDLNEETSKYTVFLVDYGFSVELNWNEFVCIKTSKLRDPFLTRIIGLSGIIPVEASLQQNKRQLRKDDGEIVITLVKEWTEKAVKFTKELIYAASDMSFLPIFEDKYGQQFGELFLTIDETVVSLNDLLVQNIHAVYASEEINNLVKRQNIQDTETGSVCMDYSSSNFSRSSDDSLRSSFNESFGRSSSSRSDGYLSSSTYENRNPLGNKEVGQTVLVSSNIRVKRLYSLDSAPFSRQFHANLKNNGVTMVRKIQSYMWPAIKKGASVVAISSSGNGKTWGHAVSITSALTQRSSIPKGNSPLVLVLCSTTKEVFQICKLYDGFLSNSKDLNIVSAYSGKNEKSLAAEIASGCQILVTTPPYLNRLLEKYDIVLISFNKLQFLVLDKADLVLEKYYDAVLKLILRFNMINNKHRIVDSVHLQIIAVADIWTEELKTFVQEYVVEPYICIDSCLEAAIFTGTESRAIVVSSKQKSDKVLGLLIDTYKMWRTIIVCTKTDEAVSLANYLRSQSVKTTVLHGDMDCLHLEAEKNNWARGVSGDYEVLICTDEILHGMSINNADHLVHFSFPPTSKKQFNFRFSTLMDNLIKDTRKSKITMLIDETNELQLKSLVAPMKRLRIPIPKEVDKAIEYYVARKEQTKQSYEICNKLKGLGFCPRKNFCPARHCIMKDIDQPVADIQIGDEVTCIVNFIHDASRFSVRITEYSRIDADGKKQTKKISAVQFVTFSDKLQKYFSQPKNQRRCKNITVGTICVLPSLYQFDRVKVTNILSVDEFGKPVEISIRAIDSGNYFNRIEARKLYELPEELKSFPSSTVDVIITGIVPFDDEYDWNDCTIETAHEWFGTYGKKETTFIQGKVLFNIANTLWLDTLEIKTKLAGRKDFMTVSSLKPHLIKLNHAIENQDHLNQLRELCVDGGSGEVNPIDSSEEVLSQVN